MTTIVKPITRETPVLDRGRPLVVTMHARYIEVRRKGTSEAYQIPWDALFSMAAKQNAGGASE